jgi:hypothetical protein
MCLLTVSITGRKKVEPITGEILTCTSGVKWCRESEMKIDRREYEVRVGQDQNLRDNNSFRETNFHLAS